MTIYGGGKIGGQNLEYAIESALGTPGSYLDWRQCDDVDPTFPAPTREVRPVSRQGYWDPTEHEAQLSYEKAIENGGTVACYLAGCSSASGTPQAVSLFAAAGCTIVDGANTGDTLDSYSSTTSFSATATSAALVAGTAGMLANLASAATIQWPFLTYSNSGASNYNIVPTMAIPNSSESGAALHAMWTITPPKGSVVASTKTLAFRRSQYYPTSTESGSAFVYTGCAVAEIKPVVFETAAPVKIEAGLHIADRAFDQSGIDLTSPAYIDAVAIPFIDGASGFLMGFVDHADPIAYPLAATRATGFRKATWDPGIKVSPVLETGATTSINGWGGYVAHCVNPSIELMMDVDKDYWTRLESSGSQTPKYIELVQKSSATTATAFGLWMPRVFMVGQPTADLYSDKEMTITVKFQCASANITTTSKTAQGNAPWYLAVSPVH